MSGLFRNALVSCLILASSFSVQAQNTGLLNIGDAVISGFSGVTPPPSQPPLSPAQSVDRTLIDINGAAARISSLARPGFQWDARVWQPGAQKIFAAKEIGQVFGVTLDDAKFPNIYLGATSAYGLHIVAPDTREPGQVVRLKRGRKDAQWMAGLWGPTALQGGPGSIWKVDGQTGAVSLFANITLNGAANAGPGLGNIAHDAGHRQLFVSDLGTGMIHRLGMDGKELEIFDHGVSARTAARLKPVPHDPATALTITSPEFDSEAPDTWGYADEARRVWGLAVHQSRLFYAVTGDSQIWSVGLDKDSGRFLDDARWELDVPKRPKKLAVSDIVFTREGVMILAQRGEITATYDYSNFAAPDKARVYQYRLESPDDPATPSRWVAEPEEYAIGFDGNNRSTNGGLALSYGYSQRGMLDTRSCEASLWSTGDNLRRGEPWKDRLLPGGPMAIDGLQGMPVGVTRDNNTPPWFSYMVDLDARRTETDARTPQTYGDSATQGWVGDVAIHRLGCGGIAQAPVYGWPYTGRPGYVYGGVFGGSYDVETFDPQSCPNGTYPNGLCIPPGTPVDIAIQKTGATTPDPKNGSYTFNLTITSNGPPVTAPSGAIGVTDIVPAGLSFTGIVASPGWVCSPAPIAAGGTLSCAHSGGAVSPGVIGTIAITATATGPAPHGSVRNCAETGISAGLIDVDPRNDRDCVTVTKPDPIVDLAIKKTGATTPAPNVPAYSFSLAVTNEGIAHTVAAGALTVTDVVPAGMTFNSVSGSAGWTCVPATAAAAGTTVTCTYAGGALAAGPAAPVGTITISATATGQPPFPPFTNCADVALAPTADSNAANNRDCATVIKNPVKNNDVAIEKTGEIKNGPVLGYEFNLAVTNKGDPITGANLVSVTDVVPAGMTFTAATGPNWACAMLPATAGQTVTCTYTGTATVATNGSMGSIKITATAPPGTSGPFKNCADVGFTTASGLTDSNMADNKSCKTLGSAPKSNDVSIKKTGTVVKGTPTNSFSYTLAVTNIGDPISAPGIITVTDVVPVGLTVQTATGTDWTCASLPATAGQTLTCTYTAASAATGAILPPIALSATSVGSGPIDNCADAGFSTASGLHDSHSVDNRSCVGLIPGIDPVNPPPPVSFSCGTNVIFVVDVSGSILAAGKASQVQQSLNNGLAQFNNVNASGTQAQAAVITFSNSATVVKPLSTTTFGSPPSLSFGGETNWEAAMKAAATMAASAPSPTIIVFITDGIPNRYIDASNAVVSTSDSTLATNEAIPHVNTIYSLGIPIYGIGIGGVNTYLDALLGTTSVASSFDGLSSTLDTLGKKMCPDLRLTKSMSPWITNYYNNPGPHSVTVSLSVASTAGANTNVKVQDILPPELTSPTSTDPNVTITGTTVLWTIPTLAANGTASTSFKAVLAPPAGLTCNWKPYVNRAQIIATDQPIHSLPNNMPASGPHEHDESGATGYLYNCAPPPPGGGTTPYLNVSKTSLESCFPSGQQVTVAGTPKCSFTVTVTAVGAYTGPVTFADAVFSNPGLTSVPSKLSGVTITGTAGITPAPASMCASTFTTLPATCTQPAVTIPNGGSLTIKYDLAAPPPLAPGDYKNCFKAAQDPAHPWTAFNASTPGQQTSHIWGFCGSFSVPGAAGMKIMPAIAAGAAGAVIIDHITSTPKCDPATARRQGKQCACMFQGMVPVSATQCACPDGKRFIPGKGCATPVTCQPPMRLDPTGRHCLPPPPVCHEPMVPGAVPGRCVCPPGLVKQGETCIKRQVEVCPAPKVPGPRPGSCVCPQGTVQAGGRCVPPMQCRAPMFPNAAGTACLCPKGTVKRGDSCERSVVCQPPARANVHGQCVCPQGLQLQGNRCIEPRPRITPGSVIQHLPGLLNGLSPGRPRPDRGEPRPVGRP